MGKKATKATKKFAAKGHLKKQIQTRQKHQQIKRKLQGRNARKATKNTHNDNDDDEGQGEDASVTKKGKRWSPSSALKIYMVWLWSSAGKGMTVDDFLGGGFMDAADSEGEDEEEVCMSWFVALHSK
jgi:nucleolar complex protein 2